MCSCCFRYTHCTRILTTNQTRVEQSSYWRNTSHDSTERRGIQHWMRVRNSSAEKLSRATLCSQTCPQRASSSRGQQLTLDKRQSVCVVSVNVNITHLQTPPRVKLDDKTDSWDIILWLNDMIRVLLWVQVFVFSHASTSPTFMQTLINIWYFG